MGEARRRATAGLRETVHDIGTQVTLTRSEMEGNSILSVKYWPRPYILEILRDPPPGNKAVAELVNIITGRYIREDFFLLL
jgi:hypothetical protein